MEAVQTMLTHEQVWRALDALARENRLSVSGLARNAGLDPTSFNKSKRHTADGRKRWPSTESLSKALKATNTSIADFVRLIDTGGPDRPLRQSRDGSGSYPLIGFAEAGVGGYFDDSGFPAGQGWEQIDFPARGKASIFALEVSGDSMMPLYRDGDIVLIDPDTRVRKGDRVVVRTLEGEVMAKLLERKNDKEVRLKSLNPDHEDRVIPHSDVDWIARIIWASQ